MTNSLETTELEQEGTPTPDSPQTIHSISGDNTIKVYGGENLFTTIMEQNAWTFENGSSYTSPNYIRTQDKISVEAGKTYRLMFNGAETNNSCGFVFYNNGTFVSGLQTTNLEVTIPNGANQMVYDLYRVGGIVPSDISNIRLYKIDQTYPISLGDIEYCEIGDYKDKFFKAIDGDETYDSLDSATKSSLTNGKWYLEKNIGKVTITGNDITAIYISQTNTTRAKTNFNFISTNQEGIGYSNYFQIVNNWSNDKIGLYYAKRTGDVWFRANKTLVGTTLESVQTWVNSHNVTLYYPLATPTYTTLPTSLQNQLEAIYNTTISYTGQTNISQVNNDLPFIISASALLKNSN